MVLVLSSVTVCPAIAASQVEVKVNQAQEKYTKALEELTSAGKPVDLNTLSKLSLFDDANVAKVDVALYSDGGVEQEINEGRITIQSHPLHQPAEKGTAPSALDTRNIGSSTAGNLDDPDVMFFVKNLTMVGYTYTSSLTSKSVTKLLVTDRMALTPKQLANAGLSWSPVDPFTLVGQNTITTYTFTDPTTSTNVSVVVNQPTTTTGDPVGKGAVGVAPQTDGAARSSAWYDYCIAMGCGMAAGVGAGYLTFWLIGGTAIVETIALTTPLLAAGGAVAGISATGIGLIVVVAVLAAVGVALLILWFMGWSKQPLAYFTTAYGPPAGIRTSDGTIVREDGTVQFTIQPIPPSLPDIGSPWVGATRTAAITESGALWFFNQSDHQWQKYFSNRTYIALSASRSWVATVAVDTMGKSYLEIPAGPDQPSEDSTIGKDVQTLNSGKNPNNKDTAIDPPVPGWKEFVAGTDYGLALSTDGRVFGVGTNKDKQCDFNGRYTHIATAVHTGLTEDDRYSLGILADTGAIDFAGDDPNSIKDAIKTANLTGVIDIAAGPDRAIAITKGGGIWNFGNDRNWHPLYISPKNTHTGKYAAVSVAHLNEKQVVFVACQNPTPPVVPKFKGTVGGTNDDFASISVQTSDGGVLLVGTTKSNIAEFHGSQDVLVAKYDAANTLQWIHSYGGSSGTQEANYALELPDGYLIVGGTRSNDGDIQGRNHGGYTGTDDVWVIKLTPNGTLDWQDCYGGPGSETGVVAVKSTDGLGKITNFTIAGWTESNDGVVVGKHGAQDLDATRDAWIFAINATGSHEILWQRCYGGTDDDEVKYLVPSIDGTTLIVAGYSASHDGDLQDLPAYTGHNAWIFAVDLVNTTHFITNNHLYGGNAHDEALYIQPTPDGGYIATGFTESADGDIPAHYGLVGSKDMLVLKLNSDLTQQWFKVYGGWMDDVGAAVRVWPNRQVYYILGSTASDEYDILDLNHGGDSGTSDIALLKLDYTGTLLHAWCFGGSNDDFGVRFGNRSELTDHSYILGTTLSNDGDFTNLNHGGPSGTADIAVLGF